MQDFFYYKVNWFISITSFLHTQWTSIVKFDVFTWLNTKFDIVTHARTWNYRSPAINLMHHLNLSFSYSWNFIINICMQVLISNCWLLDTLNLSIGAISNYWKYLCRIWKQQVLSLFFFFVIFMQFIQIHSRWKV